MMASSFTKLLKSEELLMSTVFFFFLNMPLCSEDENIP